MLQKKHVSEIGVIAEPCGSFRDQNAIDYKRFLIYWYKILPKDQVINLLI